MPLAAVTLNLGVVGSEGRLAPDPGPFDHPQDQLPLFFLKSSKYSELVDLPYAMGRQSLRIRICIAIYLLWNAICIVYNAACGNKGGTA